jgi:hypothetical protein
MGQAFLTGKSGRGGGSLKPYVVRMNFGPSLAGQTYTVSASGFTYTGTVPAGLTVDVEAPNGSTSYIVTCGNVEAMVDVEKYYGIYPVGIVPESSLHNMTWPEIADIAASGNAAGTFGAGDEKDIQLTTGEVLTLQIYGFNHDDLADGSGKAGITFGMKDLMADMRAMNSANTNAGGFTGSAMYTWLQGDLYNALPTDLKAVLKTVSKKTSAGSQSITMNTDDMKIFLFSEVEVFGAVDYSLEGEGAQYPIFTDSASRIKRFSNGAGAANSWWERSPTARSPVYSFCVASNAGKAFAITSASNPSGVCFGFCV